MYSTCHAILVIILSLGLALLEARVLLSKEDGRFSNGTHYNDVTKWDVDERLDQKFGENMYDLEEPDYQEANPIGEVVSLLTTMSQEIQILRSQMGNLKYQNHLIYKQLKRMNNRCMGSPGKTQLIKAKTNLHTTFTSIFIFHLSHNVLLKN